MKKLALAMVLVSCAASSAVAQDQAADAVAAPQAVDAAQPAGPAVSSAPVPGSKGPASAAKRVFGVLPNYRTTDESAIYTPITARQKLVIASKDSFDYPLIFLAGAFASLGQLTNQNPSFGQGMEGFGKRAGTGYADQAIGNMMSEGFFPVLLREDPRYFRRGVGSARSRTYYAISRIFVTRTDSGGRRFNFSEVLGNATGVAISNAYYPDGRTAGNAVAKLATQMGTDTVSQILKEFWPDIKRKFSRRDR